MSRAASASGRSILIFTSSRPGRRIAGSIMSSRLDAPITITFSRPSTPSISDRSCGTIVFSTSLETPDPRVRKIESISSKNTMTDMPSLAFSRARWKTSRMCRSVSPTYLLSSSGPLMLRKKLLPSRSAPSSAVRAAHQDALGRAQLVLLEQVRVQVRKLDGVADLLDLGREAADLGVGDVRHFLEDQLLDLGLGDALVHVAGPRLEQQRVPAAQAHLPQRLGQPRDPLLVRVRDDQRPVAALKDLLEHDDLADRLVALGDDHVERLVQDDFLAGPQRFEVNGRADAHPHLAAAGEHVGGAVLAGAEEHPEARGRLGQPVHLLLQRHDLVTSLPQRVGKTLVLPGDRGQPGLRLPQPLLDQPSLPRRVSQPAPQNRYFLFEKRDLRGEAFYLVVMPRGKRAVITSGHAHTSFRKQIPPRPYLSAALT